MNGYLNFLVDNVRRRYRMVSYAWTLTVAWLGLALILIAVASTQQFSNLDLWQKGVIALAALIGTLIVGWIGCQGFYRDQRWIALQIEERFPSLKQRLITAVQLKEPIGFFENSLVEETIRHSRSHDWRQTIPSGRVLMAWGAQFMSLALATWAVVQFLGVQIPTHEGPIGSLPATLPSEELLVEPGDAEIEKGTDVVVTIRFPGEASVQASSTVPAEAWLESTAVGNEGLRQAMQRSLKDPVFGGYLRNIQSDVDYKIVYANGETKAYKIKAFEYPELKRSDATIESPAYANLALRTIEDSRRVTVVDGAKLTWSCYVNKPLLRAELVDEAGAVTELTKSQDDPLCYSATFEMTESRRWKVRLVDEQERHAKFEDELTAKVIYNKAPEIKLAKVGDLRVSPLQEFQLKATAQDDFGVVRSGIAYSIGENEPKEIPLEATSVKAGKAELSHMIDLESLKALPDQLLSYFFWSEDVDRDGNPRRVEGEMFFAEVRPFEEIYREGESMSPQQQQQQQQQQQSQGEQQAEDLAELQKQIVTATWNVLRRERPKAISKEFASNTKTILESQQEAIGKTDALEEKLTDEQSLEYLEQVRDAMKQASEELDLASSTSDMLKLRSALQFERKAYEGLLRLRAREHQIVKSQQQNSRSSQSSSQRNRQEQLDQLKLENNEDRYESEQQADAAEPSAQRENRQVMNRLEELARRQKDVNEQLKNLETALQEAKTEEKKKEIEEQLERLRDNQEELLRDTDELLERMNQPENRQAMEQAREQTEQARSELQKASESLEKGQTSQSLSSGTRAERQLEETREQLRQESSNQFEQTMRNLLSEAQKLEQQQKKLTQQLKPDEGAQPQTNNQTNSANSASNEELSSPLRPEGDEQDASPVRQEWIEQKKELTELLDKVRDTVTEAESSEPLLAERLYDTFRETKQKGIEQRMDQIPKLIDRGLEDPASRAAQEVTEGIRSMREGIEEASSSVLGSEQESLRRALSELKRAQRQLNSELGEKDPAQPASERANAQGRPTNPEQSDPGGEEPAEQTSQQPSEQAGNPPNGNQPNVDQPGSNNNSGEQPSGERTQDPNAPARDGEPRQGNSGGGLDRLATETQEREAAAAPLTGREFSEWMDSLRDVEELVRDPELRAEAGRIREAARNMRVEYKRHSKEPQWPLVRKLIANPLEQLREKVQEELLRLSAERNSLVPVDRDPVPSVYQKQLDRYYENLGSGKDQRKPPR